MQLNLEVKNQKLFISGLVLAAIVAVLDLYSKQLIFGILNQTAGHKIVITGFFNLVKVYNTGVSFGLFDDIAYGKHILVVLAFIIAMVLLFWLASCDDKVLAIAIGLVIGGAFGNMIDRALFGAVADFVDIHVNGYHWPAFNVADSSITIGATILVFDEFFRKKKKS